MLVVLLASIGVAINLILLLQKLKNKQYFSFLIDLGAMMLVSFLFFGTFSGMAVGFLASAIFSLYLLYNPITLDDFKKPTKRRAK